MKAPRKKRTPSRGGKGGWEPPARLRARELRAVELAIHGSSQHAIAAELHISQAAVSKLLKRADDRVLQELSDRIERQKVRHTQRLERLFSESMTAWEKSKEDATRRRQRKSGSDDGTSIAGQTVAEVVVETQHGDPRYLESARKALTDLRKIWGLDAPQQLAIADVDPYASLTDAELLDRIAKQDSLIKRVSATAKHTEEP